MTSHAASARGLVAAFGSTFFELVGFFMLMPLLQLTLATRGISASGIGMFTALEWAGVFVVTPLAGRLARALGERLCFWLSGALPLACAFGFLLTRTLWLWCLLFFIAGLASGLRWIVGEALVAQWAPAASRGRVVGLFQTMIGVTFMLGPVLLAWVGVAGERAFWWVIALLALGVACSFALPQLVHADDDRAPTAHGFGLRAAVRAAPAIMAAGAIGGIFEVGLTGILPILGLSIGLDHQSAALLVSVSGIGSALLMLPAGALADRLDLRRIAMVCAVILLLSCFALPWIGAHRAVIWPLVFVWGGAGGALYTVAMVDLGMRYTGATLVDRAAILVMAYTLGGIIAPPLGGFAIDHLPRWGFACLFAAICGAGIVLLLQARRRTDAGARRA